MASSSESEDLFIHIKQLDQLYDRLKYSALGSAVVALAMVFIIGFNTNQKTESWAWFVAIFLVSFYRWLSAGIYNNLDDSKKSLHNWKFRFNIGAYMAAFTWAIAMWLFYPVGYPEYQVLMILGLAGVAGGAISILSYDKHVVLTFLGIILVGIESRLLYQGGNLSYELAILVFLYIIFLMRGGWDIGASYKELLVLRKNSEEHNLTLLSATERVAKIGYWQWDMKSKQVELSSNLASLCGVTEKLVDFNHCIDKVHDDDRSRVEMAIDSVQENGDESTVEYRFRNKQDDDWIIMNQVIKLIKDSSGERFLLGTVQDISVIKSAEKKIFDMAYFDELTGLANRGHFRQLLAEKIKHVKRNQLNLAVLYIDLDGFKEINDSFGHDLGDTYLQKISRELKKKVRDEDIVARLGGDEFSIVLGEVKDGMNAVETAERCLSLSKTAISIGNQNIFPKMSIGISIYPQDGEDIDTLLLSADKAMYSAKQRGKHDFAFYDAQMTEDATQQIKLESDLIKALKNNEFKLVYQPKVSVLNESITGVEALIRWIHPERGFVSPDVFIETAERIGLINGIGEWVLEAACRQQQQWKSEGLQLEMAVNISSSHFSSEDFVEHIEKVKQKFNIKQGELEIEITESMSRDPSQLINVCKELDKKGIKVAIDDFGTGYSSLSVLQQLKVNTLKIDRAFIQYLPADESSALMVRAIVSMGAGLGFDIVAEGVETEQQTLFLKQLGGLFIQGYYYSRPQEAENIPELVNQGLKLTAAS